jgi:hypothetical protein
VRIGQVHANITGAFLKLNTNLPPICSWQESVFVYVGNVRSWPFATLLEHPYNGRYWGSSGHLRRAHSTSSIYEFMRARV